MSDIDQNKLIDKYERLFAEDGWKELVEDLKERQRQLKEILIVDTSATERTLFIAQGQNSVYEYVITLESTIEAVKKNQQESLELPEVSSGYQ